MKRYIGITIGPIVSTMNLSSSPVALWASSYMFSFLSKTICECLVADGLQEEDIISPYYRAKEPLLNKNDGIGLFYDRIIIDAEHYDIARITDIKIAALRQLAENFCLDYDYIKDYIMISAAAFSAENPLAEASKILDSFELATPFMAKEEENKILTLFSGDQRGKNSALREMPAITSLTEFQLKKEDNNFVSLPDIVKVKTSVGYKKHKYYAIVRADGDNMNKIVASLSGEDTLRAFSKTCLTYCSAVAEKVKAYGGITIYSGGDDLLAILPCESADGKTPLHFAREANEIYKGYFDGYGVETALSFGIMIAFYKFPLYETLEESADLLFGVAKAGDKNNVAVKLQKHSGQTEALLISNRKLEDFVNFFEYIRTGLASDDENERPATTLAYKIALYDEWFSKTESAEEVFNLFTNLFDGFGQKSNAFSREKLPALMVELRENADVKALLNGNQIETNPVMTLCIILRMIVFFFEKEGGEE